MPASSSLDCPPRQQRNLPIDGQPATVANGGTIAFKCDSERQLREFHDVAVANGGTSIEKPPGPRDSSRGVVHLAYVREPDGNKLCAVYWPPK